MKLVLHLITLIIFSLSLTHCGRSADSHWSDGNYKVYATDLDFDSTELGFDHNPGILGLVGPKIIAAGSNSKYIVVEQELHDGVHHFYIIHKNNTEAPTTTEGPLTQIELSQISRNIDLPNFTWRRD